MDQILPIVVGLLLLVAGAELLVRSSVYVALRLGVSPLVVGLTIVSVGTSAPELVASVAAALQKSPGIAVGNIVGSNIANGLLVAGAAALIFPLRVARVTLRRDGVIAFVAALLFWAVCWLGLLNWIVGIFLLLSLALYVWQSYREADPVVASAGVPEGSVAGPMARFGALAIPVAILGAIAGAGLLAFGGNLMVEAAVTLAQALGISEAVIGLTIIAVGTSLPELVTSMLAAFRRQSDIAFGNVIGSNIFNLLGIGGVTAILSQGEIPQRLVVFDFPVMLAATAVLLLFAATGRRVGRREGGLLVGAFVLYIGVVWWQSQLG